MSSAAEVASSNLLNNLIEFLNLVSTDEFEKASKVCDQILEIDPGNSTLLEYRKCLNDAIVFKGLKNQNLYIHASSL